MTPDDAMYQKAVDLVIRTQSASVSACEEARFSALQSVMTGAKTHREIADVVSAYMHAASLNEPSSPSGSASKGWVDGVLYCYGGCGLRYRDFPCDTLLPTPLWNRIATGLPFDDAQVGIEREGRGGVLCPSCIIQRLVALPECTAVFADIEDHRQSPSGSAWQPIETAPKDGTQVLAIDIGGCFIAEYRPSVRSWVDGQARCWEPTHWMPLPMPPSSPSPTAEKNT